MHNCVCVTLSTYNTWKYLPVPHTVQGWVPQTTLPLQARSLEGFAVNSALHQLGSVRSRLGFYKVLTDTWIYGKFVRHSHARSTLPHFTRQDSLTTTMHDLMDKHETRTTNTPWSQKPPLRNLLSTSPSTIPTFLKMLVELCRRWWVAPISNFFSHALSPCPQSQNQRTVKVGRNKWWTF